MHNSIRMNKNVKGFTTKSSFMERKRVRRFCFFEDEKKNLRGVFEFMGEIKTRKKRKFDKNKTLFFCFFSIKSTNIHEIVHSIPSPKIKLFSTRFQMF